jgi:hypothetical protein
MTQSAPPPSRRWFLAVVGVAGAKKKARNGNRPKGPKTMGNLLVDGYIDDLKNGPAKKQVNAAKELGNMGASAKQALPALESLLKDGDAKVREAAQQAIKSIRK